MFKDITLGQYYQTDSVLHRLDPRVKLVGTLVYIISLFVVDSFTGYILAGIFLVCMIRLSNVPVGFIVRGMRAILILLLITMSFNLFLTPGEEIFRLGFLKVTRQGLSFAIKMAIRLSLLVIGSSLMTLTTTPNQLTDAIESLLGPMKRIRVPVHEIAMMMSIALRFIPTLMDEADKIMKAQKARGANFETGNLIQRAKAMVPLLVPLFVGAFRRAEDLALAMDARCYRGGAGRTRMKQLKFGRIDVIAALAILLLLAGVIVLNQVNAF